MFDSSLLDTLSLALFRFNFSRASDGMSLFPTGSAAVSLAVDAIFPPSAATYLH